MNTSMLLAYGLTIRSFVNSRQLGQGIQPAFLVFNSLNTFVGQKRFGCGVVRIVTKNFRDKNALVENTNAGNVTRRLSTKKILTLRQQACSELKANGADGVLWGALGVLNSDRLAH